MLEEHCLSGRAAIATGLDRMPPETVKPVIAAVRGLKKGG